MRIMTMLEQVTTPADLERVRKAALDRNWTPERFEVKAGPIVKRLARLQTFTPKLVESYGEYRLRLVPHAGDDARTPRPELATMQAVEVRRVQGKLKVRVALGALLISERAWDTLKAGGTVKVWPSAGSSMHYASLVF